MTMLNTALYSFNTKKGVDLSQQSKKQLAKRQSEINNFLQEVDEKQIANMVFLLEKAKAASGEKVAPLEVGQLVLPNSRIVKIGKNKVTLLSGNKEKKFDKKEFLETYSFNDETYIWSSKT